MLALVIANWVLLLIGIPVIGLTIWFVVRSAEEQPLKDKGGLGINLHYLPLNSPRRE